MKFSKLFGIMLFLTAILLFSAALNFAQDKKIDMKKVPAKVLASFHKAYPKAEIKGTSIETENHHKYYEIESVEGSKHIDLLLLSSGKIAEVEETIPESELPAPVMKTLNAKFKGLKINKAERVTSGKKVTYELSIERNKKEHYVTLWPNGKFVKSKSMKENEKGEKGEKGEKEENDND